MKPFVMTAFFVGTLMLAFGCLSEDRQSTEAALASLRDWSKSTVEQHQAANLLNQSKGPSTTKSLIAILEDRGTRPDVRVMVISLLSDRNEPDVSLALAQVLRPQNSVALRKAAVAALRDQQCSVPCIREVLHYLERVWYGEPLSELSSPQEQSAQEAFEEEERGVSHQVQEILARNREDTMEQLRDVYGLGSMNPSRFAIFAAGLLNLAEACHDLTRQYLFDSSSEAVRRDLKSAYSKLGCSGATEGQVAHR